MIKPFEKMNVHTPITSSCPYCGYAHNCAAGDKTPGVGDLSICARCLRVVEFNENLILSKTSFETQCAAIADVNREVILTMLLASYLIREKEEKDEKSS